MLVESEEVGNRPGQYPSLCWLMKCDDIAVHYTIQHKLMFNNLQPGSKKNPKPLQATERDITVRIWQ